MDENLKLPTAEVPRAEIMANSNPEKEICILCDFVNESTVDVGYAEWLKPELSNEKIEEVIRRKSDVVVYWPNCDTAPPGTMKKRLEDNNCTWKTHATKIIAQGGWTEMCEQLKNYIKHGIAESMKNSRKSLRKKYLSSDDSDDTDERTRDLRKAYNRKKRKTENLTLKETGIIANCTKKKGESCIQLVNDARFPDEDDEDLRQYSKKHLMSTIEMLRSENRCLREENDRLKSLRSVNDDLPAMKKLSTEILRNLRATSALVGLHSSAESRSYRNDNASEKNDVSSTLLPTLVNSNRESFPDQQYDVLENTSSAFMSPCKQLQSAQLKKELPIFEEGSSFDDRSSIKDYYSDRDMSPALSLEDGPKPIPDQEFSAQETFGSHQYFLEENPRLQEELVDLGAGCLVDADQLSKCSRKNATKLTCDILSLIFTREELASSSLTGKVPNTHKKAGIRAKKKLDPAKVAAVLAFVVQEFGATATKGEILTAIKNKCNNTAKAVRREKERSFSTSMVVQCSETV